MVVSTVGAGSLPAGLQGRWAGDQLQLVIDDHGGRVEGDCASGQFAGPVTAALDGRFKVQGSFEQHRAGPHKADVEPSAAAASFSGEFKDGVLKLTIAMAGGHPQHHYSLVRGANIKLHRCL